MIFSHRRIFLNLFCACYAPAHETHAQYKLFLLFQFALETTALVERPVGFMGGNFLRIFVISITLKKRLLPGDRLSMRVFGHWVAGIGLKNF